MKRLALFFTCILLPLASPGQIDVRDSLQKILQNNAADARDRFNDAGALISYHASPEEAEDLGVDVLYPFGKQIAYDASNHATLARIYLFIYQCWRERGGDDRHEQQIRYLKKAVEEAKKSGNDMLCAATLYFLGATEIPRGDWAQGSEHLYEAIRHYDNAGMFTQSTELLHIIATGFFDMRDIAGMERTLRQMEAYFDKDKSGQSLYQYNYIKLRYFECRLEKEQLDGQVMDRSLLDSVLLYARKNINLVENHLAELDPRWMHAYVYYNMANALDRFNPGDADTILAWLDKAYVMYELEEYPRTVQAGAAKEFLSSAGVVRARVLSRKGLWAEAHKVMTEAIALMDAIHVEREKIGKQIDAYQFMTNYYERAGQPAQQVKYLKLLRESEAKLYEKRKIEALNDNSIKYETEKKELQIEMLTEEKKAQRRIFISLTVGLLVISVLIIISGRLKRKNIGQRLYETALLAELNNNELEKIKSDNLNADRQGLERYRVQNTIESIARMISDSMDDPGRKKIYLDRLSRLDGKVFDSLHQDADTKITAMDMKYLVCFAVDMDVKDIGLVFNVDPASVRTVRYRIRKKLRSNPGFL